MVVDWVIVENHHVVVTIGDFVQDLKVDVVVEVSGDHQINPAFPPTGGKGGWGIWRVFYVQIQRMSKGQQFVASIVVVPATPDSGLCIEVTKNDRGQIVVFIKKGPQNAEVDVNVLTGGQ
ncbi:hypothetical protein CDAR_453261 [Caerostris darwini]|uniref:Uncharacterized protein n=1 Tax=Caerostris darwini TaxID=1538125 RepID=A0AAV4RTP7_9ARAC|nr:hypothetical protein CDAR_453261 [Caerostris darwini]